MRALKVQAHLHDRGGVFYFRVAYPKILVKAVGMAGECKISLRTRDVRVARRLVCLLSYDVTNLFETVSRFAGHMTPEDIKQLVRNYFEKKLLDYSEQLILERSVVREDPAGGYDPKIIQSMTAHSRENLLRLKRLSEQHQYTPHYERMAEILVENQEGMGRVWGEDKSELCHGLVRADIEAERINLAHLSGNPAEGEIHDAYFKGCRNFFDTPNPRLYFENIQTPYIKERLPQTRPAYPLSEAVSRYMSYRRMAAEQSKQSLYKLNEYKGFFDRLCDIWGKDRDVGKVSKSDCRALRDCLYRFPKNFTQKFGKNGTSLMEVLAGENNSYEKIGSAQAKKMWDVFHGFFVWCRDEEMVDSAPTEGIKIESKKHTPTLMSPYT